MILSSPTKTLLSVREVTQQDQRELASLFHFESYVHRHLDWRGPLDWIGYQPFLAAVQNDTLMGALACPEDIPGAAWIQVFAAKSRFSLEKVWNTLWRETREFYQRRSHVIMAVIPNQPWFSRLLLNSQFRHTHSVVVLVWENSHNPPVSGDSGMTIREMQPDDLEAVHKVDLASFDPLWQQSPDSLKIALQQACFATVSEIDGQIIGYQISTGGHLGGHLARLAVHPAFRGEHIGQTLVQDMLDKFRARGTLRITVNTQQDNSVSLKLYEKTGFRKTGETFQVFTLSLGF